MDTGDIQEELRLTQTQIDYRLYTSNAKGEGVFCCSIFCPNLSTLKMLIQIKTNGSFPISPQVTAGYVHHHRWNGALD